MADWYYLEMDKTVGPLTNKELLDKVRNGDIQPETQVRKDDAKWVAAYKVNGLFEQAGVKAKSKVCPYCGTMVEKTPGKCASCNRFVSAGMDQAEETEQQREKFLAQQKALQSQDEGYIKKTTRPLFDRLVLTLAICFGLSLLIPNMQNT